MKIKLATSQKKRKGYRYDPKRECYITYKIDGRVAGKRKRTGGFTTKKAAEDFISDLTLAHKYKKSGLKLVIRSPRVSELFEKRLAEITNEKERVRGKRVFAYFLSKIQSDPKVTEIGSAEFQIFKTSRLADGVKKETVNREMNLLSKAFADAPMLFPRELEGYEKPKLPRPKVNRKTNATTITPREKDSILKNFYAPQNGDSNGEFKNRIRIGRMFELAWFLGMAYKEVAWLLKTDYSPDGEAKLSFTRHKTGQIVKFEWLPDRVHEIIREAIADSETEFIFTRSGSTPKDFYEIMRRCIEGAGIVYGRGKGVTFHSTRHTFVTTAMQHADLKTVGSMSGHTDETMVLRYTHASPETRKRALQSMYSNLDLRDIFNKVRAKKMRFEEFEKLIR